jgi:hypothetical protein
MPEKLYTLWLDDLTFVQVEFLTVRGRVVSFVVRLMRETGGRWINVVRYDTAPGVPHRDVLDKRGRILRKDWLAGMTFEAALTPAKDDLLQNYERYIENLETN